jgi:hypothetical protein
MEATSVTDVDSIAPRRAPTVRGHKPLHKIVRKKKRVRYRGVPPPFRFDINVLPDSTRLTPVEVAAILRRTPSALENWRTNPDHPLKWQRILDRITYELGDVRAVLKGGK